LEMIPIWNEENQAAFRELIAPLLQAEEVQAMRGISQHAEGVSCYEHCVFVSYVSFLLARRLGLDCRAAARGGLLHDLYLCDWSKTDVGKFERLVIHPLMALQNAEKFGLNDLERDIIVKHMWPLTRALPRHRESFVVSLADKLCATAEMLHVYKAARVGQRLVFAPAAENA